MSFSYCTVYVAFIVLDSFDVKSPTFQLPSVNSIPASSSVTTTFVRFSLPLFVTINSYSITSPAWTFASLPMLFPSLFISVTFLIISISAVPTSSSFVSFPPTVATFLIIPSISVTLTIKNTVFVPLAWTSISFHSIFVPSSSVVTLAPLGVSINSVPAGT